MVFLCLELGAIMIVYTHSTTLDINTQLKYPSWMSFLEEKNEL